MSRGARRHRFGGCILAVCLVVGQLAAGCRNDPTPSEWLDRMAASHRAADQALEQGQADDARALLRQALEEAPPPGLNAVDVRVVRQDFTFRLGEIALSGGDAEAAQQWAEQGLALGRGGDLFEANLLVVRGRARERLGLDAEAANDFYDALRINERLLRQQLEPEGTR